jgi:hypothetical protein
MSELTPNDPAYTRYADLIAAIGGVALSAYERGLLVHIASWLSESKVTGLCRIITRSRQAVLRHQDTDPTG